MLLQDNLLGDVQVLDLLNALLNVSDASKNNEILINLLGNDVTAPIPLDIKTRKFDLRDNHAIEVLIGGGFTTGFTTGFNTV